MLIVLEVLAMESESIVGIYYGKQETFPCPPRVLSPLGLESIVPGVVPGVGIHVNQGPQVWSLTWCLENSLKIDGRCDTDLVLINIKVIKRIKTNTMTKV